MDKHVSLSSRDLHHKNILTLLGISIDGDNIMIIMESCSGGNLKSFLRKNKSQATTLKYSGTIFNMVTEMAEGLEYLHSMEVANKYRHSQKLTHNITFSFSDFAARNCQVTYDGHIKIGDYGLSRHNYKVCC